MSTDAVPRMPEPAGGRSGGHEQRLAMAKLREIVEADEREYGPVDADALRRAVAER